MKFKLINTTTYEEKQNINEDFSKVSIIRTQKKTRIYIRVEQKKEIAFV